MSEPVKNGKPKARPCKVLAKHVQQTIKDDLAKKSTPMLLDTLLAAWEGNVMVRQPARLSLVDDGGSWRVTIECPTEGQAATFMCDSLATLLGELETMLASGKTHWGLSWQRRKKNLPTVDEYIQ